MAVNRMEVGSTTIILTGLAMVAYGGILVLNEALSKSVPEAALLALAGLFVVGIGSWLLDRIKRIPVEQPN